MATATKSKVKLESSDGKVVEVGMEVVKCSETIKTMLETLGESKEDVIPLTTVHSSVLQKIIEWGEHHKDDPVSAVGASNNRDQEKRTDDICRWDADFVKRMDQGTLFDLILASNYLDIKGLLELMCKSVANMIKNRTPEEIRRQFGIKNDFSRAREEQIRKQNEWCYDK